MVVDRRRDGNPRNQSGPLGHLGEQSPGRRVGRNQLGQSLVVDLQQFQQLRVRGAEPRVVEHADRQARRIVGPPAAEPPDDQIADESHARGRLQHFGRLFAEAQQLPEGHRAQVVPRVRNQVLLAHPLLEIAVEPTAAAVEPADHRAERLAAGAQ